MAYDASGDLVYDISSESKVVHLNDHFKILDGKLYTYVDAAGKWITRSSSKDKIFMATNHIGTLRPRRRQGICDPKMVSSIWENTKLEPRCPAGV